mmetsp:Transcript_51197/g.144232  ORF Transcript_51197/g.144232 Transcript_51197/m.144232 type:complete len:202 (+) Transcript_51197:456-1061(+)
MPFGSTCREPRPTAATPCCMTRTGTRLRRLLEASRSCTRRPDDVPTTTQPAPRALRSPSSSSVWRQPLSRATDSTYSCFCPVWWSSQSPEIFHVIAASGDPSSSSSSSSATRARRCFAPAVIGELATRGHSETRWPLWCNTATPHVAGFLAQTMPMSRRDCPSSAAHGGMLLKSTAAAADSALMVRLPASACGPRFAILPA